MTDSEPPNTDRPAAEHPHEGVLERAVEAVRARVRSVELGLVEGDHTPVGEISGVIEELAHPQGEEDPPRHRPHGVRPEH